MGLRAVFVGAVECSRHCLLEVLRCGVKPVAIYTLPPERASLHADYADLSDIAMSEGIPVHLALDLNAPEHVERLERYQPDVIFVWGWSRLIGEPILKIPRLGCVGFHPALLPTNRGRHPIVWTIVLELPFTGVTFFWMDAGADSGDILTQRRIEMSPDEDARTLYDKVKVAAAELIREFVPRLEDGIIDRIPQDHSKATVWRKRGKNDGLIDFRMSAVTIDRLVRALTKPYVGAHIVVGDREIKVWKTRVLTLNEDHRAMEFGRVLAVEGRQVCVRCGEGEIALLEHELEPMPKVGDCL